MVRKIMYDKAFLKIRSVDAVPDDINVGNDLRDTLSAHRNECVGMAANMIGVSKRIIIINAGMGDIVMYNPSITKKENAYKAQEGCLSIPGIKKVIRFKKVTVRYLDEQWTEHEQIFTGFAAQIVQHEIDHCNGILV